MSVGQELVSISELTRFQNLFPSAQITKLLDLDLRSPIGQLTSINTVITIFEKHAAEFQIFQF